MLAAEDLAASSRHPSSQGRVTLDAALLNPMTKIAGCPRVSRGRAAGSPLSRLPSRGGSSVPDTNRGALAAIRRVASNTNWGSRAHARPDREVCPLVIRCSIPRIANTRDAVAGLRKLAALQRSRGDWTYAP